MAVKAVLKVVLMAGENVVAESEDSSLWQAVLSSIYGSEEKAPVLSPAERRSLPSPNGSAPTAANSPTFKLARALDVTIEQLVGACRPREEEPYLTIDLHCWEAFRRGTPPRGPGALGATAVVGTLLGLWMHEAELEDPSLAQTAKILERLSVRDSYPRRTIRNCDWLQLEADRIKLNPAKTSMAKSVARAFIRQDWSEYSRRKTATG